MSTSQSESALLWLLNSSPVVRGVAHDHLDDDVAASRALEVFGASAQSMSAMIDIRETLQRLGRVAGSAADLNRHLEHVVQRPRIEGETLTWELDGRPDELSVARVVLEWMRVRQEYPGRLRPCSNSDCTKFLLDHSRPNTAKWCSMAECGNRLKARRHAARQS